MSLTTKVGFLAGAAATSLAGAAFAGTSANVSYEDLQQRLDAAETKIAELSSTQNADWLTEQRAEEIRGLVQDVLADADTRASLQGSGMTAGYDNGFVISSNDGNWNLRINGLLQNRLVVSHTRDDQNPLGGAGPGEKTHDGFETTRAVLNFSGTVAKDYHFNMRLNWSPYSGGNTPSPHELEWAYASMDLSDEFNIQIGKQKYDVMREYMVNAEFQQTIERSLYTYYWGTSSITNGIKLNYQNDSIRANVMYSNGGTAENWNNATSNGAYSQNPADWAFSGRVAWKASGTWEQFDEMTSPQGTESGILIGMGWAVMDGNDNLTGVDTDTNWMLSWDASADFGGWNLFGSISYGDDHTATEGNQWGWMVQGGYYLTEDFEIYGRWEWLDPRQVGSHDDIEIMTFGANWYMAGQNAKLSIDWGYNFDRTTTAGRGGGGYTNWLDSDQRNEWVLRTQLQLYF